MAYKPKRKKPIAEINVVPYIDVMLVLLVIFMITAPLLTQGVRVDLPQATAEPLPPQDIQPVIVTVDAKGLFYIDLGNKNEALSGAMIRERIRKILQQKPNTPVMLRGDRDVAYGAVVDAMVEMQAAGAASVGLVTETPES
ncbi:MAG: protein TolR [gamma proteobacterium symbiont of Bathyaustriella thionipta]|nr:protein TolR [gamma proteobacterium symbiont of Bathyaustriella thionipta]